MINKARFWLRAAMAAVVCLLGSVCARAYTLEEESEFAETLAFQWRMSDFAMKALDEWEAANPADKQKLVPSRVLVYSAMGRLTNAEALVAGMKAGEMADAAKIALAKAYYRANMPQKSKEIYSAYFTTYKEPPKDPIQLKAFRTACSEFGAMMKAAGDEKAALQAGRLFLKTSPVEEVADAVRCDMGVLVLEAVKKNPGEKDALLKEGEALCDTVLKHGVNLFWGQALSTKANMKLARGDRLGAQKLIKENMDVLKPLDDFLTEANRLGESPLAGVRMLNAHIYEDDARAALEKKDNAKALELFGKAINEYYNVFVKYGDSDYGLPAGSKFGEIKKLLEAAPFNKKIKITLTAEQEEKVLAHSFRLADQKMRERDFDKASPEYLRVLKDYPESDRSVRAIGSLLRCYAEMGDKLMVKVTSTYIGERFYKREFAADLIRGLGKFYLDKKDEEMFTFVCDTYTESFPKDQNVSAVLLTQASLRQGTNDFSGAKIYLERVVKGGYTNDAAYVKTLGVLASIYLMESNFVGAAAMFKDYAEMLPVGIEKFTAQSKQADAIRLLGNPGDAAPVYAEVAKKIEDGQLTKASDSAVATRAKDTLERCLFYQGVCYSRMTNEVDTNRQKAVTAFNDFLKQYPNSTNYAPKAMAMIGQVSLLADKFDDAAKVFEELAKKYPNSPEGKNALISLVQSALEIKRLDQAKKAFAQMTAGNVNVSTLQYLQMGQLWLDGQVYDEAAQSFAKVIASNSRDANVVQPALFGLGKSSFEMKKYKEATDALARLVKEYERTPYFFESQLILATAFGEQGKFADATEALSGILVQPQATPVQKLQAQYEIAVLQEKQGQKTQAFASNARNVELASIGRESNPDKLAWIEKMLLNGLRIGLDIGNYTDVINMCEQYEKLFPAGKNADKVRKAKSEAVSKAASAPAAPAAPAAGAK